MMTTAFIAFAGLTLGSTPALPRDKPAAPKPSETPAAASAPAADETRYCVVNTVTGSRISHKTCRTRADWLKEGFDPLAK